MGDGSTLVEFDSAMGDGFDTTQYCRCVFMRDEFVIIHLFHLNLIPISKTREKSPRWPSEMNWLSIIFRSSVEKSWNYTSREIKTILNQE